MNCVFLVLLKEKDLSLFGCVFHNNPIQTDLVLVLLLVSICDFRSGVSEPRGILLNSPAFRPPGSTIPQVSVCSFSHLFLSNFHNLLTDWDGIKYKAYFIHEVYVTFHIFYRCIHQSWIDVETPAVCHASTFKSRNKTQTAWKDRGCWNILESDRQTHDVILLKEKKKKNFSGSKPLFWVWRRRPVWH